MCTRSGYACARVWSCTVSCFHWKFHRVPVPSVITGGVNREEFIGLMQRMIRREGRGLCFDRVTAAGGGGVCCCFRAHAQNSIS